MKIAFLLTHLTVSGVTRFCDVAAKAMRNAGHDIDVVVGDENTFACWQQSQVVESISKNASIIPVEVFLENSYDIVFQNYNTTGIPVNKNLVKKVKFICHGLELKEYAPPKSIDELIVFGERAYNFYNSNHPNITLIRNFVDEFRNPALDVESDSPKKVLLVAARDTSFITSMMMNACTKKGWYLSVAGQNEYVDIDYNYRNRILESDLVVGVGRCMYEAMAMGKPVVNFGINGGDGYVKGDKSFRNMMVTNGSGYTKQVIPSPFENDILCFKSLLSELDKYDFSDGQVNYELAQKYLSPELYIDKMLKI